MTYQFVALATGLLGAVLLMTAYGVNDTLPGAAGFLAIAGGGAVGICLASLVLSLTRKERE